MWRNAAYMCTGTGCCCNSATEAAVGTATGVVSILGGWWSPTGTSMWLDWEALGVKPSWSTGSVKYA